MSNGPSLNVQQRQRKFLIFAVGVTLCFMVVVLVYRNWLFLPAMLGAAVALVVYARHLKSRSARD